MLTEQPNAFDTSLSTYMSLFQERQLKIISKWRLKVIGSHRTTIPAHCNWNLPWASSLLSFNSLHTTPLTFNPELVQLPWSFQDNNAIRNILLLPQNHSIQTQPVFYVLTHPYLLLSKGFITLLQSVLFFPDLGWLHRMFQPIPGNASCGF